MRYRTLFKQYIFQWGMVLGRIFKKRKFFTERNAKKIQACINCIDEWYRYDVISENERKVLIASLINSFDKIANTAGTYYAYLKEFDRRSLKEFSFSFLPVVEGKNHMYLKWMRNN